ncbi:hypothetical protein ACQKWADRAFT_309846 [Trichoderma austrokoningii]
MGHQQLIAARPSQDCLDIVATQGAYLAPRPRTSVFQKSYDEEFLEKLGRAFEIVAFEQCLRKAMYQDMEGATSDESSDGDEADDAKARADKAARDTRASDAATVYA